ELRELDLHLGFGGSGARGEDVEDELRAVHHAFADRVLDVLALAGTELVVEDDERRLRLADLVAQLVELAGAEVGAGMGLVDLLRELADDDRAAGPRTLQRHADEQGPLDRRRDDNRFATYLKILFIKRLTRQSGRREPP